MDRPDVFWATPRCANPLTHCEIRVYLGPNATVPKLIEALDAVTKQVLDSVGGVGAVGTPVHDDGARRQFLDDREQDPLGDRLHTLRALGVTLTFTTFDGAVTDA